MQDDLIMRTRVAALLVLSVAFFSPSAVSLYAQSGSGDITGEVRDASGGLVSGAKATLVRVETQEQYASVSSEGGVYSFFSLKPGVYTVNVEVAGFKRFVRTGVVVS